MNDAQDPAPINPGGKDAPGGLPEPSPATLAAGNAAVEQHVAESPTGKRKGRPIIHGRYVGEKRGKSKPTVPVAKMDNGTRGLLLEEDDPGPAALVPEVVSPAFNEEVNRKMAGVIVAMFQRINLFLKHGKLEKKISRELADFVIERKGEIPAEPRAGMELGLVECARKYDLDLSKTPEGMFFLALAAWKMEDVAADTRLIAEYYRLRPGEGKP